MSEIPLSGLLDEVSARYQFKDGFTARNACVVAFRIDDDGSGAYLSLV